MLIFLWKFQQIEIKYFFKKFIITNEVYPNSKSLIQRCKIISYVIHYTNRLKKKNYIIIISIEAKKKTALDKISSW